MLHIRFNSLQIFYNGNRLTRVCIFNYYLLDTNTRTEFFSLTSTPNELSLVTEMRLASDLGPYLEANEVEETKLRWKAIRVAGKVFLSQMIILKLLLINIPFQYTIDKYVFISIFS